MVMMMVIMNDGDEADDDIYIYGNDNIYIYTFIFAMLCFKIYFRYL